MVRHRYARPAWRRRRTVTCTPQEEDTLRQSRPEERLPTRAYPQVSRIQKSIANGQSSTDPDSASYGYATGLRSPTRWVLSLRQRSFAGSSTRVLNRPIRPTTGDSASGRTNPRIQGSSYPHLPFGQRSAYSALDGHEQGLGTVRWDTM